MIVVKEVRNSSCKLLKRCGEDYKLRRVVEDQSLADLDNLPDRDVPAAEIAENLERALKSLQTVIARLKNKQSYL